MPLKILFTIGLFVVCSVLQQGVAQNISASVTNSLRYGSGRENIGEGGFVSEIRKEYLDNVADSRFFINNVIVGFRFDLSQQPEYGVPYRGIRKKFVEYNRDGVGFRAGDVYALFNNGLSLNLFENRALAFDNGVEGIRASYRAKQWNTMLIGGEVDYIEPVTIALGPLRIEHYSVRGGIIEFSQLKHITLSGSYISAKGKHPTFITDVFDSATTHLPEVSASLHFPIADMNISYVTKTTTVNERDSASGSGFYASVSHTGNGYGITFEYKDYRFDIVDDIHNDNFRTTRMLPLQNPPTVHKEHSYTLLTRYPHVTNFNDEVGFQLDAFYAVNEKMTLNGNIAHSSRHYAFENINFATLQMERRTIGSQFLPSFAKERSPFWEIYADVEYFFADAESYFKIGINRRSEITYTALVQILEQYTRQTAIPAVVQYTFNEVWSAKLSNELQWVTKFPETQPFFNHLIAVQLAHSPDYSVGLRYEYTTHEYEPQDEKHWLVGEVGYHIGANNLVGITYGAERGGQVCSNGICRVISPYKGFRLSFTSQF